MYKAHFTAFLILLIGFTACNSNNGSRLEKVESVDLQKADFTFFEDSIDIQYAKNFKVDYFSNYKRLAVYSHVNGHEDSSIFFLVKRGTPYPKDVHASQVVEVPVRKVVALSNTQVGMLDRLQGLETLRGVEDKNLIPDRTIRKHIESGKIQEVGGYNKLNEELVIAMKPDVVLYDDMGASSRNKYPALRSQGICLLPFSDWQEQTPLGRTEWLKLMALLLDKPERAVQAFERTTENYNHWVAYADTLDHQVNVMCGLPFKGVWYMPGGNSFTAQFIKAAGAQYLNHGNHETGGFPLDFEVVYKASKKADVWINTGGIKHMSDLLSLNENYKDFKPVMNQRVYNNNGLEVDGVNAFWYTGYLNPDLVLHDLIKIFHPEVVQDSTLTYYRHIE
ncbi:ABC transporter substrate-binding protein [Persicobacter psychrovividus]|uniref:ABC transporter substrate-binding protein n=1 Tax=Persicobacter psychrovividus TaxID=387638 RepID=A0ABN6LCJ0_9BACT|nr:ABC transporter substrate-binding protein [Persicobacter psychrovividus]